ncbi:hypothetical protein ACK3TF_000795 [Chlorella vulgaris]
MPASPSIFGAQVNSDTPSTAVLGLSIPVPPFQLLQQSSASYTCMLRVANSTPIVDLLSRENSLRVNRLSRHAQGLFEAPGFDQPTRQARITCRNQRAQLRAAHDANTALRIHTYSSSGLGTIASLARSLPQLTAEFAVQEPGRALQGFSRVAGKKLSKSFKFLRPR